MLTVFGQESDSAAITAAIFHHGDDSVVQVADMPLLTLLAYLYYQVATTLEAMVDDTQYLRSPSLARRATA